VSEINHDVKNSNMVIKQSSENGNEKGR